ncbi:hypothetical protein [Rhodococcus rhodochrous]|uniref:hypothetical protein n=1 Tax=Rhodococcus rhodochrous TaxID=1829 RepID=UPI001784C427|nr:hypothetical protein [Rhodococcus rhodochrous]
MKERDPTQNAEHFHYKNSRDHVLHDMALNGWANQSGGETESHVGQFWRISTSADELAEVVGAFEREIEAAGLTDPTELIGHWLLCELDTADIVVMEYHSERGLLEDFENLTTAYKSWQEDQQTSTIAHLDEEAYLRGEQEAGDA